MNEKTQINKADFQNFSWFQIYVYKLGMIMCIIGIDYCCRRDFTQKITLILWGNDFGVIPLGKCAT